MSVTRTARFQQESENYDAPCLTKITLDSWMYFGQLEVLSTAGGSLDNCSCSWLTEILLTDRGPLTTRGTPDNCSRQTEILPTIGGSPRQLEVLRITALGKWRYCRLLEVPSTTRGTLDNCSWQTEILPTTFIGGLLDNSRYSG